MSDKALMGGGGGKNGEARKAPSPIEEIAIAALKAIVELNRCGACDGNGVWPTEIPRDWGTDDSCAKCCGTGFKQIGGGDIASEALRKMGVH